MFISMRTGAAALAAAAISSYAGAASADPVVITVPGGSLTHTIPGTATPQIGPYDVATPQISVPRVCAGTVFCAGPIDIPPQTIVSVPRVSPVPLTPPITVTATTTNIVAVVNPVLTSLVTVPPTTILVPNPFGGEPIPVEVCPNSCSVPGAQVVDGATGSVTIAACAGAVCESETVPVMYGNTSPGQICFTQATHSTGEGNSGTHGVTLSVQRIGGSFGTASVSWSTQPGSALPPGDYLSSNGGFTWASGQSDTRSLSVSVVGDTLDETDESFSVVLSGVNGATLCQPSAASVTIIDDDAVVPDEQPDQFLFIDRYPVSRGAMIYSNIVTISGINKDVPATASGGEVANVPAGAICDGTLAWGGSVTVSPGGRVCVRHLSSAEWQTSVSTTLSVGSPAVSDTFTSTTREEPIDECPPPGGGLCP
jgi:hypothetical protein